MSKVWNLFGMDQADEEEYENMFSRLQWRAFDAFIYVETILERERKILGNL